MSAPTIVIPTLNEAGTIARVLQSLPASYVPGVVIVDGGSTDGTAEIARDLGFAVIRQEGSGLGDAIKTGVRHSRSDVVVTMDADGAHAGEHVIRLLQRLDEGYDLVVASRLSGAPDGVGMFSRRRRSTEPQGLVRGFGNRLFTSLCRALFGVPVHDVLNGCKAFRRQMFVSLPLEGAGQEHDVELVIKAHRRGYRVAEIAIEQAPRLAGASKLSAFRHGFAILSVIVREAMRAHAGAAERRQLPRPGPHSPVIALVAVAAASTVACTLTAAHEKYGRFSTARCGPVSYNAAPFQQSTGGSDRPSFARGSYEAICGKGPIDRHSIGNRRHLQTVSRAAAPARRIRLAIVLPPPVVQHATRACGGASVRPRPDAVLTRGVC